MINPLLHKKAVPLDRVRDRNLKLSATEMDWSIAAGLNALFAMGVEFGDLSREYPILFVPAGADDEGRAQVAPVAAFGLKPEENLFLQGTRWRGHYIPALLRIYPFSRGRLADGSDKLLCVDIDWKGFSQHEGTPLFNADGTPGAHLVAMNGQLETVEAEILRTQAMCAVLMGKGLLRDMRFDADLPDGQKLQVEGFMTIDEQKLAALGDADIVELQRSGVLALIHAHLISMGNMRKLVQWRLDSGVPPA